MESVGRWSSQVCTGCVVEQKARGGSIIGVWGGVRCSSKSASLRQKEIILLRYYICFGFLPVFATRFEMKMWEGTARAGLGACFKTYLFVLHKMAM